MTAEEISKYAINKLKLYGVKLNKAEEEEALNWLVMQIGLLVKEQRTIAVMEAITEARKELENQNLNQNNDGN
jgi:aspartate/tyrosine/aromatic aminotransferase